LTAFGSEVVEVNLLRDEIPPETSLLIIAAPKSALKPDEIARIKLFSERGGPLLILVGNQADTGLEELLRSFNVLMGRGIVVDRRLSLRGQPQVVYVPIEGASRHPVVDSLMNRAVLLPAAAPLKAMGAAGSMPLNPNVVATPILRTSKTSWAETDLTNRRLAFDEGKDESGPLTVGVAVSDRPKPGALDEARPRLVVVSSPDAGINYWVLAEPTNQDLLMNAISWLRGKPELQGIAPKTHVALTLVADPALRLRLILVPTVMALILIISMGVVTYLARRE
jgi:hypothetical protein